MRFIADESCDFAIVRAMEDAGHDVLTVSKVAPGSPDDVVLALAVREGRILLTEDKDFGRWVYADKRVTKGVVLLRYPLAARSVIANTVVRFVEKQGVQLPGAL